MTNVPSKRDAASLLVSGTMSVVGSLLLKADSCRTIAGRSPVCACPGAAGMSTRQTSPFFIRFHLLRETLDHFDGARAGSFPVVELLLELRRNLRPDRLQMDFNACPFGKRRIGNDDAVGHDARDGGGHDCLLL